MKEIAKIPYEETDFYWVENHWDIHLSGICKYENKLCYFISNEDEWNQYLEKLGEDNGIDHEAYTIWCHIYKLNLFEKIKYLWQKKLFEICVGTHWTYKDKSRKDRYYKKKPIWLSDILFNLYYYGRFTKKKSPAAK